MIGIVGMGFVGLPLAVAFVRAGHQVVGVDLDEAKINRLNSGTSYIRDVPDSIIEEAVVAGRLCGATDYGVLTAADAILICVPTPLTDDHKPDMSYLIDACKQMQPFLRADQLIVIESSTYPGTTTEVAQPLLESGGLKIGKELHLAYSPERIDPGNDRFKLEQVPKVVSGVTPACLKRVSELYGQVFEQIVPVATPETAETVKLLENTFRLINISFINEFARLCDQLNVDIWELIRAAATKPYGFMPFYPGPGIGGHCIPVDPLYLQWKATQSGSTSRFIELAQQVNDSMADYIAGQLGKHLANGGKSLAGSRILVYGVTYKKDVADVRESSAIPLIQKLLDAGAEVQYNDPYVPTLRLANGLKLQASALTSEMLEAVDCLLIHTDHEQMPAALIAAHSRFIYDTRNSIQAAAAQGKLVKLGGGTF